MAARSLAPAAATASRFLQFGPTCLANLPLKISKRQPLRHALRLLILQHILRHPLHRQPASRLRRPVFRPARSFRFRFSPSLVAEVRRLTAEQIRQAVAAVAHPQVAALRAAHLPTAVAVVVRPQVEAGAHLRAAVPVEVAVPVALADQAVLVAARVAEAAGLLQVAARVELVVLAALAELVAAAEMAVLVVAAARLPVAVVALPQAVAAELPRLVYRSPRLALYCCSDSRPATCCGANAKRDKVLAVKSTFY
jgi:hypothetical protein